VARGSESSVEEHHQQEFLVRFINSYLPAISFLFTFCAPITAGGVTLSEAQLD